MRTPDRLLVFALGTFHAALITVLLVFVLHLQGTLHSLLSGLGTWSGFGIFIALWMVSWWATRGTLDGVDVWQEPGKLLGGALFWGAVAGPIFLLALVAIAIVPEFVKQGVGVEDLVFLFFLVIAAAVAALVGALIGAVLALIDHGLLAVARVSLRDGGEGVAKAVEVEDGGRPEEGSR